MACNKNFYITRFIHIIKTLIKFFNTLVFNKQIRNSKHKILKLLIVIDNLILRKILEDVNVMFYKNGKILEEIKL